MDRPPPFNRIRPVLRAQVTYLPLALLRCKVSCFEYSLVLADQRILLSQPACPDDREKAVPERSRTVCCGVPFQFDVNPTVDDLPVVSLSSPAASPQRSPKSRHQPISRRRDFAPGRGCHTRIKWHMKAGRVVGSKAGCVREVDICKLKSSCFPFPFSRFPFPS